MTEAEEKPTIQIDPTKDLWQNISANVKESASEQTDQSVFVVGAKSSGKSTIINRIQGTTTKPKPTTALEYCFGKRDDRSVTQVAHMWELAQAQELSQLCEVVITPENVHAVTVVIVADCADTSTMFDTVFYWLKRIDRRVEDVFKRMRSKNSQTPDKLIQRAQRMAGGEEHPDFKTIRFSGVPIVIVCNRLDLFKGDTTRLKLMARTMRYLAHLYGAALIFTSEQAGEVQKLRSIMNYFIFQVAFDSSRYLQMDPERGGVLVMPDRDSFRDIGDPNTASMADFKSTGDSLVDRWKAAFDEVFPPKKSEAKLTDDPFLKKLYDCNDGFGEPAIDSMRKQKDEELEQYRRNNSKKQSEKKEEKDA